MKKLLFSMLCIALFTLTTATAQQIKTQDLNAFTELNIEGHIELHLVKSTSNSIKIETKKEKDFEDFTIKLRNDKLYLGYTENKGHSPKFIVYLNYASLEKVEASGLISLFSEHVIEGSDFTLKGSGIIKGEIAIAVKNLKINSEGITNLSISGTADEAIFNIDGLGKINAKKLETKSVQQRTDGFAKIKMGS